MGKIDKRGKLQEAPFSYQVTKSNKMRIFYDGRQIKMLNEKQTMKLLPKVQNKSDFDVQLALAKITGNFKHGNERNNSNKK